MSFDFIFPTLDLKVKTKIKVNLEIHGQVESFYETTFQFYRKYGLEYPKVLKRIDRILDAIPTETGGRCHSVYFGNPITRLDFISIIKKQKNAANYLFFAGHEEGHICDYLGFHKELEELLKTMNVNIDLKNIPDPEIRADLAGLFVIDRAGYNFKDLSWHKYFTPKNHLIKANKTYNYSKSK